MLKVGLQSNDFNYHRQPVQVLCDSTFSEAGCRFFYGLI